MAMAAAFDSSRLGLKGKERSEILESSGQKKFRSIEEHIEILKEKDYKIDKDYIKNVYATLTNKEEVEFRTLPRYRRYTNGKMLCSTDVEKDLDRLIEFINHKDF
jgi:hypothetical protein